LETVKLITSKAIDFLETWDAAAETAQFACLNPHWWMGKDRDGYWWSYSDSDDDPDYNDYERANSADDLRERFGDIDDEWALVEPERLLTSPRH
jgi:hypothetical protein